MAVNLLDIIIIAVIGLALLRGLWNGFLVEAGGIAGLAAGLLLASRFYANLAQLLDHVPWKATWNTEISFAILFLAGVVIIHLFVQLLRPLARQPVIGSLNSLAGLVAGAVKGSLWCAVVLAVLRWFVPGWELLRESRLQAYLIPLFNRLYSLLPW